MNNSTIGVYKITNTTNGKGYIGISKHISNRWNEHKNSAKRENPAPLYKAMRKHGIDNFVFEVLIALPKFELDVLYDLEVFFIADQNTYIKDGRGYNLNRGGGGNFKPSPYTRNKMSKSRSDWHRNHEANFKGRSHTEEWKLNASLRSQGNSGRLGKHHSEESKLKMSEAKKGSSGTVTGKSQYIVLRPIESLFRVQKLLGN